MLNFFLYIVNLIFIILYLYPGSILGFLIYDNFYQQPKLTNDINFSYMSFSSNHIISFFLISFFSLVISINKKKMLLYYLFLISIILEALHTIIPNRSFQISDLYGNILGVILALIVFYIFIYAKKYIL